MTNRNQYTREYYIAKCVCCGESEPMFLAIDHINGGGSKERKTLKNAGTNFYRHIVKNGYPKNYRILCHNCNQAKGYYGRCPHENMEVNND